MAFFRVQNNRSTTLNQRPLPSSLLEGQTAVNLNHDSPGLFFKTTTGALAKAGPVAISATEPTLAGHDSYSTGEMWLDTVTNTLRIWDGTAWVGVESAVGVTTTFIPPTSPTGLGSGAVWNNNGTLNIVS